MSMLISIVAGALIGVVIGRVRVPRTDWLSLLSLAAVIIGSWWAVILSVDVATWDAVAFVTVSLIISALYSALLWQRSGVAAPSFLRLTWWSFWRPSYVEQLHAGASESTDVRNSEMSTSR